MRRAMGAFLLGLTTLFVGAGEASAGQFKKAVYYRAGQKPYRSVAGQFTQSGNLDLAFADWIVGLVVILLGDGDGTFQPPRAFPATNPVGIAKGDFNEDGIEDLAVVEANGTGNGSLAIFLGDGKGDLKLSTSYGIGVASSSVAVADFNGDGHLDVAVTDQGFGGASGDMIVFFGNGQGKLHRVAKFKTSHQPIGIAAGDLNGDHHPDLAMALAGNGSVAVFLNDGTGHFQKPVSYDATGGSIIDVKIADLRHNGLNDLALVNDSTSSLVILLNKGNGILGRPASYQICQSFCLAAEALVVEDFNLDGILDVAVAGHIGDGSLYYGKGDGTFKPAVRIHNSIGNFQDSGPSIVSGDFNHDKAPDLAIPIQNRGKVAIMINTR